MIYWSLMLFGLGGLALADYSVTGGKIFGPINSIMFFVLSLAILIRIRKKQQGAQLEKLHQENEELKIQLAALTGQAHPQHQKQETLV